MIAMLTLLALFKRWWVRLLSLALEL